MKVDCEQSIGATAGKRLRDLDLWTRDLENLLSSWSDCKKYLWKFWLKCLQWFRSCPVHTISMPSLPLNPWPWKVSFSHSRWRYCQQPRGALREGVCKL